VIRPIRSCDRAPPQHADKGSLLDSKCIPHSIIPSVSQAGCLEIFRNPRRRIGPQALNSHVSRSMYQELKPMQMIAPVIASNNASSFEPEGQSRLVDEKCPSHPSVSPGHSRCD
jgi:hypothetical protein